MDHTLLGHCGERMVRSSSIGGLRFRADYNYSEGSVFTAELWECYPDMQAAVLPEQLYYYYQREGSLVHEANTAERNEEAELFTEKVLRSNNIEFIYLDQAMKRSLSAWYLSAHILVDIELARKSKELPKLYAQHIQRFPLYYRNKNSCTPCFAVFPGAMGSIAAFWSRICGLEKRWSAKGGGQRRKKRDDP